MAIYLRSSVAFLIFCILSSVTAVAQVPPPCPESSSTKYSGPLPAGGTFRINLNLAPCQTLLITVEVDPKFQSYSTPVSVRLYNNAGQQLVYAGKTGFGRYTMIVPPSNPPWMPPYRGTRGAEGLPAYGILKADLWDLRQYTVTVKKTKREDYNVGGTSFGDAPLADPLPATYYGSLHHFEPGQFYRIQLNGNQGFFVSGYALGHPNNSPAFTIKLYDASFQEVTGWAVNLNPHGVEQFSSAVFANASQNPAVFYLKVRTQVHPTHDFKMTIHPKQATCIDCTCPDVLRVKPHQSQ